MTDKEKIQLLRNALIGIVGESGKKELERMRSVIMGLKSMRNDDKKADVAIDGINALLLTADQEI